MVRDQAQVVAAGPHVVRQPHSLEVDKDELGGYQMHRRSAMVHNEADPLAQAKWYLYCLPHSIYEPPLATASDDDPNRAEAWPKDAIPHDRRKIFDRRKVIAAAMDRDSLFDVGCWQAGSVVARLGRVNGFLVGIVANDPKVSGGAMTLQSACKMERHSRLCSQFGLPVVNFVDQPGDATGPDAELEKHYIDLSSPMRTAEKFGVLDVTDPRETRMVLCDWLDDAWHVVQENWCSAFGRAAR